MPRKKKRGPPTKKRHSSREGTPAATYRIPEVPVVARRLAPPEEKPSAAKALPDDSQSRSMAALIPDVTPLSAVKRPKRRVTAPVRRRITFVVERDAERVDGYRSELARPPVAPGWHPNWVPDHRLDLHGARVRDVEHRIAIAIRECLRRSVVWL